MSSSVGISGSTSVVVGWDGRGSSVCFSVDVSFFMGDVLSFSDLVCFLPGSYSHPVMDVKNRSAISVYEALNFVHILFWR